MTSHTAAAKVWDAIEQKLLRLRMIYDGRDLRENRAELVRVTGEALGAKSQHQQTPANAGRQAAENVPLRLDDSGPRRSAIQHQRIARGTDLAGDDRITRMLDKYLDASTKAGGYSEDDEVPYGRR